MRFLYFDESIQEKGDFIIGALVASDRDLSLIVRQLWLEMGLDPDEVEFKSSSPKAGDRPKLVAHGLDRRGYPAGAREEKSRHRARTITLSNIAEERRDHMIFGASARASGSSSCTWGATGDGERAKHTIEG